MDKKKLIAGHKYLRRRKTIYGGREMEAESWVKCLQITKEGAVFLSGGNLEDMTEDEIKREIIREA